MFAYYFSVVKIMSIRNLFRYVWLHRRKTGAGLSWNNQEQNVSTARERIPGPPRRHVH